MKKKILITGSTDGIGKLAAIKFAQAGHAVYLHGRNAQKVSELVRAIQNQTQNPQVEGFVADFSDLEAVHSMAQHVQEVLPYLDVLINNAGVFHSPKALNTTGLDMRYVVNYLAPFVLTKALLPLLQKGTAPRLINLSSAAQAPVDFDILQGKTQGSARSTYAQSKLALTMWSFFLAKQLPNISITALNPGSLLNTRMVQEAFGTYWAPPEKGASIIYDLAVAEQYGGIMGKYYDNDAGSWGEAHADAYDERKIEKLITTTEALLEG